MIDELQKTKTSTIKYISSYDNTEKSFSLNNSFIQKTSFGNDSNSYIEGGEIKELCKTIQVSKTVMLESLIDSYKKIINNLSFFSNELDNVINFVSLLDVIYNKSHVAKLYNYSKPVISIKEDSAFFDVKGLRHPLIENLLNDETYVPNDLCLNNII